MAVPLYGGDHRLHNRVYRENIVYVQMNVQGIYKQAYTFWE